MPEGIGIEFFATLGVGGALAGFIFFFYRKDKQDEIARWKGVTETLTADRTVLVQIVRDNTAALQQQTEVARALHKRLDGERDSQSTIAALQAIVNMLERRLSESMGIAPADKGKEG